MQGRLNLGRWVRFGVSALLAGASLWLWARTGFDLPQSIVCWMAPDAEACTTPGAFSAPNSRISPAEYEVAEDGTAILLDALKGGLTIDAMEKRAAKGDAEALYLLGLAKLEGLAGVKKNASEARTLLQRSADAGFPRASFALGGMLQGGEGGDKDEEAALAAWTACYERKHPPCAYALGFHWAFDVSDAQRDYNRALPYFNEAAAMGHAGAIRVQGDYRWFGYGDQPVDRREALEYYERAVASGSTVAMERVAFAHRFGIIYRVDKYRAVALLQRAAERGNKKAAVNAARMLIDGEPPLPANPTAAAQLLVRPVSSKDWEASALFAKLLINRVLNSEGPSPPTPAYSDSEIQELAIEADRNGYPEGLGALTAVLREGTRGWQRNLKTAGELSVPALARAEARSIDDVSAWPLWAKGFAYTIQKAVSSGAETLVSADQLARIGKTYGEANGPFKRFTMPVTCDGAVQRVDFYLWDTPLMDQPATDLQFDWIERAGGCSLPTDVRDSFRKLFKIAKENQISFTDLVVYALESAEKKDRVANAGRPGPFGGATREPALGLAELVAHTFLRSRLAVN